MADSGKIYFASDFHLGVPDKKSSRAREDRIISWLNEVAPDAKELFLVGDIFDFWFEYKTVVPKGYVRLLGKLAEIKDSGTPIHYFTGNHDMWMFGYLSDEIGVEIHRKPVIRTFNGKKFMIGHGDGLGPKDTGYKLLKRVFRSPACQFLFGLIHPDVGMKIANGWSKHSRFSKDGKDDEFKGEEDEWLIQYCKRKIETEHFDYFIFGHRHLPIDHQINEKSRYINLGDWIKYNSYGVFDGEKMELRYYSNGN